MPTPTRNGPIWLTLSTPRAVKTSVPGPTPGCCIAACLRFLQHGLATLKASWPISNSISATFFPIIFSGPSAPMSFFTTLPKPDISPRPFASTSTPPKQASPKPSPNPAPTTSSPTLATKPTGASFSMNRARKLSAPLLQAAWQAILPTPAKPNSLASATTTFCALCCGARSG